MEYGVLLLRLFVGAAFVGHGTQKLFAWFGGYGPSGTANFFGQLGYKPARAMAMMAGLSEVVGGILFGLGFLTPLGALLIATVMLNAIRTVTWGKDGLWKGSELEFLFWVVVVSVAAIGPLRFSLDRAIGWDDQISGVWWGLGVAAASLVAMVLTTSVFRRAGAQPQTQAG